MHGELGLLSRPLVLRGSELLPEYTVFAKRLISTPFTASLRGPFVSRLLDQLLDRTSDPANGPPNCPLRWPFSVSGRSADGAA